MKATFFERLGAYLIDMIIISLIFTIICAGFGNTTTNAEKAMQELDDKLLNGEVTNEEYLKEYPELYYDYQKDNVLEVGISVALTFVYYIVFQYMNKGQTLGKKLLNIKVVDKDSNEPISILKGFLRTFIIQNIISSTLGLILVYILNKESYFAVYATILSIEMIFILITTMFVLYRNDSRGLHDKIANTVVVKGSR